MCLRRWERVDVATVPVKTEVDAAGAGVGALGPCTRGGLKGEREQGGVEKCIQCPEGTTPEDWL